MHGRAWAGVVCAGLWASLGWLNVAQSAETWRTLTRSVEDRVIEYCRFGQGERQVLVVAPLAGDEAEGVELAERLASHLEQFPRRLTDTAVTIVRDPNPDGRFRRTAANAHGVLLDRNFRTRLWRKMPQGDRWLSGREPESESETRALADLLEDLKPQRIIVFGSSRRGATLNYAGPAERLAGQFAASVRMRALPLDSAAAAGAFAAYAGVDRGIPTLIVRVPAHSSAEGNWSNYKRALLAAIDSPGEAPAGELQSAGPSDAPGDSQEPRRLLTTATPIALQSPGNAGGADLADGSDPPPRVLSAKDLEHGGVVMPIRRPPKAAGLSPTPSNSASPLLKTNSRQAANPSSPVRPRGAKLYDPTQPRAKAAPSNSTALPALATPKRVERLPPVDRPGPVVRDLRQEPIPFYPGTGY